MEFLTIANKVYLHFSYEVYLTFFNTFKGCTVSVENLNGFCKAFNLDIAKIYYYETT